MLSPTGSLLLNGVCPYYTMYPIEFPLRVLGRNADVGQWVLDPFCGRGTTLYAARSLGLPAVGIDSNHIAAAVAAAKLATATPAQVVAYVRRIIDKPEGPREVTTGEFWRRAYHADTLLTLCKLREGYRRTGDDGETATALGRDSLTRGRPGPRTSRRLVFTCR
jgi:hypothetical protein